MKLDRQVFLAQFPKCAPDGVTALIYTAERYNINTPLRLACWLGQMAVESKEFTVLRESLNYRFDKLQPLFGARRINQAQAKAFGRIDGKQVANQEALANILYGGEWGRLNLGNTQLGDGWKFRGRCYKQITGRYNYTEISARVYGDDRLVKSPELLELPIDAAICAGAFWDWKKLNPVADTGDVEHVTAVINGGVNGLDARKFYTARVLRVLAALPKFDNVQSDVTSTEHIKGAG